MAHPKGQLIERLAKLGAGKPEFRTVNTGPSHQPTFLTDVVVDGEVYGTGQGPTKREAERLASEEALEYLDREGGATPEPEGTATSAGDGASGAKSTGRSKSSKEGKSKGTAAAGDGAKTAKGKSKGGKAESARDRPVEAASDAPAAPEATSEDRGAKSGRGAKAGKTADREPAGAAAATVERAGEGRAERTADPTTGAAPSSEPFEGPWPIFENVLEAVIEVANDRVDEDLTGEEARVAIRDFSLGLYKEILENLGEVIEDEYEE